MATPPKAYKLRRKSDGLFSSGGTDVRWTTRGKTWSGLGPVKNHLRQFHRSRDGYDGTPWADVEVVELVVVVSDGGAVPVGTLLAELHDADDDREVQRQKQIREFKERQYESVKRQLASLEAELGVKKSPSK